MNNGDGIRVSLFVCGCSLHCPGCQSQLLWNPNEGNTWNEESYQELIHELDQNWCEGLTITGGEPLFPANIPIIDEIISKIKQAYPTKSIWLYTGYTWEEIMKMMKKDAHLTSIINHIDVLLEGRYLLQYAGTDLKYVGSSNKRIIDVKKSLQEGKIILYMNNGVS